MGTPNDLLGVTDLIALHCAFTDESVQIVNAEFLQQVKPCMNSNIKGKKMLNVLMLPCSADCREAVWMEICEKAISILQSYFLGKRKMDNLGAKTKKEDIQKAANFNLPG
ncbi:hypothetical protein C5167_004452 [Papaver somniferum]|uniref:Uncharacterized protein n=1 Tax=Papaver somniferum TaxID=3469 RepID=A0A4Y7J8K2_PAPSO|nr:hypothetical protein C5167_004452 [Papaver somniferum]